MLLSKYMRQTALLAIVNIFAKLRKINEKPHALPQFLRIMCFFKISDNYCCDFIRPFPSFNLTL